VTATWQTLDNAQNHSFDLPAKIRFESNMSTSSSTAPPVDKKLSLWLRAETKTFEARAALTPTTAQELMQKGFEVIVERDPQRIFEDLEYEQSVASNRLGLNAA
jgi:hypothetical protein